MKIRDNRTNTLFKISFAFLSLTVLCCIGQFPGRYERIESDKIRSLALVYDPAEAAPGDTVLAKTWFSGEPVDSVAWKIVLDISSNILGSSSSSVPVPIDSIMVPGTQKLDSTAGSQVASVSFVLPSDLIARNLPADFLSLIPKDQYDRLPAGIGALNRDSLLSLIDYAMIIDNGFDDSVSDSAFESAMSAMFGIPVPLVQQQLAAVAMVCQFATVNVKIIIDAYTKDRYMYSSYSYYTVRFNGRFRHNRFMGVNNNPVIHWIDVYGVKNGISPFFNPATDSFDTVFHLYRSGSQINDTVHIQKGYSYYIACDSGVYDGVDYRDATYPLALLQGGTVGSFTPDKEYLEYHWFFRNEDDVAEAPLDSLLLIAGSNVAMFLPPVYTEMKHFTVWSILYDSYFGEKDRPRGFAIQEVRGVLKYSDAYVSSHK